MVRFLLVLLPLFFLASCHRYNMLDGKSRPVYFSADSPVFNDPEFPKQIISYDDLLNLRGNFTNVIELKKDRSVKAIINRPTICSGL